MIDKWTHDKYEEDLQNRRTDAELIERYGFNIRDCAPDQIDFSRPLGQSDDGRSPAEVSVEFISQFD